MDTSFLRTFLFTTLQAYLKNPTYDLGKEIIVVGGGDSALDDARTALRLSQGGNVTIVYRRTEKEMPADPIMVEEAVEEGVQFRFLADPKAYNGEGGKLTSITMNTMQVGCARRNRAEITRAGTGAEFEMKCSAVLLAVGRGPNSFLPKKEGLQLGSTTPSRWMIITRLPARACLPRGMLRRGRRSS